MIVIRYLLLLTILMLASCSTGKTGQERIRETFQSYRTALLDKNGEAAWREVDSPTKQFYAQVLQDALSLPRADLERIDFMHKFIVLRLRHEFHFPVLQNLTGEAVFVLGVTNGWVSSSTVQNIKSLHKIIMDGQYATAYLPQSPTTPVFYFVQEGREWKLSLMKSFELANSVIGEMREQKGLSEREFIIEMLQSVSKHTVDESIFDGPLD